MARAAVGLAVHRSKWRPRRLRKRIQVDGKYAPVSQSHVVQYCARSRIKVIGNNRTTCRNSTGHVRRGVEFLHFSHPKTLVVRSYEGISAFVPSGNSIVPCAFGLIFWNFLATLS